MDDLYEGASELLNVRHRNFVKKYLSSAKTDKTRGLTFTQQCDIISSYEHAVLMTNEKPHSMLIEMLCILISENLGIDKALVVRFVRNELADKEDLDQ
jgi:hypothetical protein